jgi:hypothetical protein
MTKKELGYSIRIEELYNLLLAEKDKIIRILENQINFDSNLKKAFN